MPAAAVAHRPHTILFMRKTCNQGAYCVETAAAVVPREIIGLAKVNSSNRYRSGSCGCASYYIVNANKLTGLQLKSSVIIAESIPPLSTTTTPPAVSNPICQEKPICNPNRRRSNLGGARQRFTSQALFFVKENSPNYMCKSIPCICLVYIHT